MALLSAQTNGLKVTPMGMYQTKLTVRKEAANGFVTISISDDDAGLMLQIAVNPTVKKLLTDALKEIK